MLECSSPTMATYSTSHAWPLTCTARNSSYHRISHSSPHRPQANHHCGGHSCVGRGTSWCRYFHASQ
jgi:hypothetical protein